MIIVKKRIKVVGTFVLLALLITNVSRKRQKFQIVSARCQWQSNHFSFIAPYQQDEQSMQPDFNAIRRLTCRKHVPTDEYVVLIQSATLIALLFVA